MMDVKVQYLPEYKQPSLLSQNPNGKFYFLVCCESDTQTFVVINMTDIHYIL